MKLDLGARVSLNVVFLTLTGANESSFVHHMDAAINYAVRPKPGYWRLSDYFERAAQMTFGKGVVCPYHREWPGSWA
jgi:hypothetical protein